jgi:F-type H+-transporting ATPase subunit epsilon
VLLRGGLVRIFEAGKETSQLFVGCGFAEITPERCTVLANEAIPLAELSKREAADRLKVAESVYEAIDKNDVAAREAAEEQLYSARVMGDLAQAP